MAAFTTPDMRRNRKKCSLPWSTLLAEALVLCCLVQSRGRIKAFTLSPCSPARGYRYIHRPTSGTVWRSSDLGGRKSLPGDVRRNYRLKATAGTPRGTYDEKTILIQRRRRGERESRRPLSQQRWHRRYCAASSVEEHVSANEMDGGEANRLELDLEASSRDELQQEEEEEEESGGEFPQLPEEFKDVRGAFLDGPGQYLDVEKILAQTEHIDHTDIPEGFRTGYVTIVGSPNVGKSTLMNNMIGDRLSIVTPKAGTTRHRITGIMTGDDFQIVYQDTPGVLTPAYMLHEGMMNFVQEAMGDADAVLFVTDLFEAEFSSPQIFERMLASGKPIVVAVNKVDLLPSDGKKGDGTTRPGRLSAIRLKEVGSLEDILERWRQRLPGATVLPISALEGINTSQLAEELKQHIPEGPPLYATDVMSDKPLRFFASEIIREQLFVSFSQEIPYSCEVRLDKFKERQAETVIDATIVVSQESQKGMVIGKGGAKIKEVGIKARNALEDYLGVRVNLRLNVKVDKNWRKKKQSLKEYGYIS